MVKRYCDKCGKVIEKSDEWYTFGGFLHVWDEDKLRYKPILDKKGSVDTCLACGENFLEVTDEISDEPAAPPSDDSGGDSGGTSGGTDTSDDTDTSGGGTSDSGTPSGGDTSDSTDDDDLDGDLP